jgi:hypothetical protein
VLDLLDPLAFTLLLLNDRVEAPELPSRVPCTVVRMSGDDVRTWATAVGLADTAAVLVRPDGHVVALAADPEDLAGAMISLVGEHSWT